MNSFKMEKLSQMKSESQKMKPFYIKEQGNDKKSFLNSMESHFRRQQYFVAKRLSKKIAVSDFLA